MSVYNGALHNGYAAHRRIVFLTVLALVTALFSVAITQEALAENGEPRPSVLIVDANLGDYDACATHWLGQERQVVANDAGRELATAATPTWWASSGDKQDAPSTFVLGITDASHTLSADDIVWALDSIRAAGAEQRSVVIAVGPAGLRLREYAEDLATTKQSARADIVGLGFCGTPHSGYSAQETYPELGLWNVLAEASGFAAQDLVPGSAFLASLDSGVFPSVSKTLVVSGIVGDLGFGSTDGAAITSDLVLAPTVTDQLVSEESSSTISQQVGLSRFWMPFTSSIDYPGREVDANLAERLSAMDDYVESKDVQKHAREFYESWYTDGSPVTHNSSVLAIDLSGSMLDSIEPQTSKLDAAKVAASEYVHAMQACAELPHAAPMDVSVLGFNVELSKVANTYDTSTIQAIGNMQATTAGEQSETNIGIALDEAVATLSASPTCAKKHILLLSDGASTRGKSNEEMMATCVADAKEAGIIIDVVGFGDVGESNAEFLKQVASTTGGIYYEANDSYDLKKNFLAAHYGSLGLNAVDEELPSGTTKSEALGTVDDHTSALQLGVVSNGSTPDVKLFCNGEELDASLYTTSENSGLLSIQLVDPPQGEYSLELSGASGAVHLFAAKEQGISSGRIVQGEEQDWSLIILAIAGGVLVVGLIVVIVLTRRRASR